MRRAAVCSPVRATVLPPGAPLPVVRRTGTKHEAEYKMWYHFSVEGGRPGQRARIAVANLNPMAKVYAQDLRPLVRVPSLSPSWER